MNEHEKNNTRASLPERSLDDLFREATKDARFLESEPIRRAIIESTTTTAIPALSTARFGMPLKIRIWTMSAVLVALLGLYTLGAFQTAPIPSATSSLAPASVHSQFTSTVASFFGRPAHEEVIRSSDTGFFAPVHMQGIEPAALTEAQAAQLGITYFPNGDISCKFPEGKVLTTLTCSPDGHLAFGADSTTSQSIALNLRLITTTTGEKRFFQFADSSFPFQSALQDLGVQDSGLHGPFQTNMVMTPGNAKATSTDLSLGNMSGMDSVALEKLLASQGLDLKAAKQKHMQVTINFSSTLNNGDTAQMTKFLQGFGISPAQFAEIMKSGDSATVSKLLSEKIAKALSEKMAAKLLAQKGAMKNLVMSAVTDLAASAPNINALVPVLVVNTLSGVPDSLVFWFDPSPELESILGSGTNTLVPPAQVSESGALTSLSITPNPATSAATLHYTLTGERSLAVSLYDITGNKVLDAARLGRGEAGSGELHLDLSHLTPGIYILAATTNHGEQLIQRIVVER